MEFLAGVTVGMMMGVTIGSFVIYCAFDDELKAGIVICRKIYYRASPIDPTLPSGKGT